MELYYSETMNPRKACTTAKYLALPVTYRRVDLSQGEHKTPAHLARNPNGRVPVLVDGDLTLWESVAIMIHFANKAGSDLWPSRDATRQAEVMRWISWDLCEWMPHVSSFYFEHLIKPGLLRQSADPQALEAATPPLHASAKVLDSHLAQHEFVAGTLSIADFCLGILLPYSQEIHLPLAGFKHIQRWHDRLMQLDSWRNPWPS